MQAVVRYFRLWLAFGRFGLIRELAFRANFVVKVFVEILWLCILLICYRTVFTQTSVVAEWTESAPTLITGANGKGTFENSRTTCSSRWRKSILS